jgi:hypothetical protein
MAKRKDISLLEFYLGLNYLIKRLENYDEIHNLLKSIKRKINRINHKYAEQLTSTIDQSLDESKFNKLINKAAPKFRYTCNKLNKLKDDIDANDWKVIQSNLRKLKHRKNTTTIVISTDIYNNLIEEADSNYSNELIYNNILIKKLIKMSKNSH